MQADLKRNWLPPWHLPKAFQMNIIYRASLHSSLQILREFCEYKKCVSVTRFHGATWHGITVSHETVTTMSLHLHIRKPQSWPYKCYTLKTAGADEIGPLTSSRTARRCSSSGGSTGWHAHNRGPAPALLPWNRRFYSHTAVKHSCARATST